MNETQARSLPPPFYDRIFFRLAGFWFVLLTIVGFSPTFYFRIIPKPLPGRQIIHGVVFSAWVVLFFVQTLLIAGCRVRWHMLLGPVLVLLPILMVPTGFDVVLVKASMGLKSFNKAGFNLTELTLGFTFVLVGVATRKWPFVRKRLMLFATLMLTVGAANRVALVVGLEEVRPFRKTLALVPVIALIGYDLFLLRRFPKLSLFALVLVWLVTWFVVTDLVFSGPAGEGIIKALTRVFVW